MNVMNTVNHKKSFESYFKLNRFGLLIRRQEIMNWRGILTAALTITGITVVIMLLSMIDSNSRGIHEGLYPTILFIGGFAVASGSFKAMHSINGVHDWLMLPASQEEKFLSRLLISSLGYWLLTTLVYFLASVAGAILSQLLFGDGLGNIFNPFSRSVIRMLPHYLILQSLFFAGGAVYRKHQLLKTVMTIAAGFILYGILAAIIVRLLIGGHGKFVHSVDFSSSFSVPLFSSTRRTGGQLISVIRIFYYGLLAPFCWTVAYLRVREAEVRNAV